MFWPVRFRRRRIDYDDGGLVAEAGRRLRAAGLPVSGVMLVESVAVTVTEELTPAPERRIAAALGGIRHTAEQEPPGQGVLYRH